MLTEVGRQVGWNDSMVENVSYSLCKVCTCVSVFSYLYFLFFCFLLAPFYTIYFLTHQMTFLYKIQYKNRNRIQKGGLGSGSLKTEAAVVYWAQAKGASEGFKCCDAIGHAWHRLLSVSGSGLAPSWLVCYECCPVGNLVGSETVLVIVRGQNCLRVVLKLRNLLNSL